MPRFLRTLRGQLLVGLLVPLIAIAFVNVWFSYLNARRTAYIALDHTLLASANSIAEQIRANGSGINVSIPPSALGMFAAGFADIVYYRVTDAHGRLIVGYMDLPPDPQRSLSTDFYDARFRGAQLRLVTVSQPVPSQNTTLNALVTVGVTLNSTDAMIRDLWVQSGFQQGALVAIAFVLAWLSVLRGFKPLLRMGREVTARRPNEFKPFDEDAVQRELLPFVRALNRYMERLSRQLASQRRFIANAAHQLRTPLTLLRTQAQMALREDDASLKDEAARGVIETTKQMTRLTNQLLILSKSEGDSLAAAAALVDVVQLTRKVLEEYADLAVERNTDLAFEAAVPSAYTFGDATMLREVVANIADNALRYAAGTALDVSVDIENGRIVLRVCDRGPGIPSEDRELVFERFYRVRDRAGRAEGSGLGLAIVREIVTASGGTVELANNRDGAGLAVTVSLPHIAVTTDSQLRQRVVEDGRAPLEQNAL